MGPERGAAQLYLGVTSTNDAAVRLYHRCGFQTDRPAGATRSHPSVGAEMVGAVTMVRDVPRARGAREELMDTFETIRTMLAVRRYQDKPVPEATLRRVVEAGRLTGSAKNLQPWHFVVVQDREDAPEAGRARADRRARRPGGGRGRRRGGQDPVRRLGREPGDPVHAARRVGGRGGLELGRLRRAGGGARRSSASRPSSTSWRSCRSAIRSGAVGRGQKDRKPLGAVAHRERYGQAFA